ncbi:acetyltransferase, GNAT family family [Talaromyces islandicus]|uniref:Acetyltransferase, GNAT family family n=1 Tax=Talaromyces islandicus TaxID=28573 RepID=A0A0U1LM29_TALIS|nr:acetyltransferase, GNAT family family [Talaromyces islandicus]
MIQHDPITKEPYIRLPAPLSHIILTPPRLEEDITNNNNNNNNNNEAGNPPTGDLSAAITALNDPRVFLWLEGPPYPYLADHASSFIRRSHAECQRILRSAEQEQEQGKWADGCPFTDIRDTSLPSPSPSSGPVESGDAKSIAQASKIGDFKVVRYPFYELARGSDEQRDARLRNEALTAGDEAIEWSVGFWLAPSHHRQGIMSAALQSIISEWAIPRMNAWTIGACTFVENTGSKKTLEKCGFVFQETIIQGSAELPEAKGGGRRDLHVLKWRRNI